MTASTCLFVWQPHFLQEAMQPSSERKKVYNSSNNQEQDTKNLIETPRNQRRIARKKHPALLWPKTVATQAAERRHKSKTKVTESGLVTMDVSENQIAPQPGPSTAKDPPLAAFGFTRTTGHAGIGRGGGATSASIGSQPLLGIRHLQHRTTAMEIDTPLAPSQKARAETPKQSGTGPTQQPVVGLPDKDAGGISATPRVAASRTSAVAETTSKKTGAKTKGGGQGKGSRDVQFAPTRVRAAKGNFRIDLRLKCVSKTKKSPSQVMRDTIETFCAKVWQGDATAVFYPWKKEDTGKQMVTSADEFKSSSLHCYFNRLANQFPNGDTGFIYVQLYLGFKNGAEAFKNHMANWMDTRAHAYWELSLNCEEICDHAWLKFSCRQMNRDDLKSALEAAANDGLKEDQRCQIGVVWKELNFSEKTIPKENKVYAYVIQMDKKQSRQQQLLMKIRQAVEDAKAPLLGIRMRYIPNFAKLLRKSEQELAFQAREEQAAFLKSVKTLRTDSIQDLSLEFKEKDSDLANRTLRSVLQSLQTEDKKPLFHCIAKDWRDPTITLFVVAKDHVAIALTRVGILYPFLLGLYPECAEELQSCFTEGSVEMAEDFVWDPVTQELISPEGDWFLQTFGQQHPEDEYLFSPSKAVAKAQETGVSTEIATDGTSALVKKRSRSRANSLDSTSTSRVSVGSLSTKRATLSDTASQLSADELATYLDDGQHSTFTLDTKVGNDDAYSVATDGSDMTLVTMIIDQVGMTVTPDGKMDWQVNETDNGNQFRDNPTVSNRMQWETTAHDMAARLVMETQALAQEVMSPVLQAHMRTHAQDTTMVSTGKYESPQHRSASDNSVDAGNPNDVHTAPDGGAGGGLQ